MRVLVCPHQLSMGGSQLNALELASSMSRYGNEPVVYAAPGVLADVVRDLGLEWAEAPAPHDTGLAWSRQLHDVVQQRNIEMVHTFEWRPGIKAALAGRLRVPTLMSVMAMDVPAFLPNHLPITVGTPALRRKMLAQGRTSHLLEPPVDLARHDVAGPAELAAARARWQVPENAVVVSMVTMLTTALEKLQGVLEAIRVVDRLAAIQPIHLLIAGDGEGAEVVRRRAEDVNRRHGKTVIQPVGFQLDPTSVYAAADVMLGMGASALTGLAHGKALIVQGEAGFWRILDEASADGFIDGGWFGHGGAGSGDLQRALKQLIAQPALRSHLGAYGRTLMQRRYGMDAAAAHLAAIYVATALGRPARREVASSMARSMAGGAKYLAAKRFGSVVGREQWAREGAVV